MDALALTFIAVALLAGSYWIGRSHGVTVGSNLGNQIRDGAKALAEATKTLHDTPPLTFDPPVAMGAHFRYLGLDLICVGHTQMTPFGEQNCIRAEYVDHHGSLRFTSFTAAELDALRIELARNQEGQS